VSGVWDTCFFAFMTTFLSHLQCAPAEAGQGRMLY
jgi:hypothetical protein